jgi:HEAT repeat protein
MTTALILALSLAGQDSGRGTVPDLTLEEAQGLVRLLRREVSDEVEDRLGASHRTSLPALTAGLASPDAGVRSGCVRILGQIGSPACGDALLTALKDQDARIRGAAVGELSSWIRHEPAAKHIVALLADPDESVRYQAAWFASWFQSSKPLLESALRSEDERMRAGAIRAIAHNSSEQWDERALEAMYVRCLRDPSPLVRAAVCDSLYFDTSLSILPDVLNAARDEDARVRASSAEALRGATDEGMKERAFAALVDLLDDSEPDVRKSALEAVAEHCRFGRKLEQDVVDRISDSLRAESPSDLLVVALETVGRLRLTELTDACRRLMESEDASVALAAAVALFDLDEGAEARKAALAVMGETLTKGPDESVRSIAAFRIGSLRSPESDGLLCKALLEDASADVRDTCGNMLGGRGTEQVTDALLAALSDFEGAFHSAAWALACDREQLAFEPILKATRHEDSEHRLWAAKCLETLDFKRAAPRLIEMLGDPSSRVRLQVASTFEYDQDERALPELRRLAKSDWSRFVRQAAADAVKAHGSVPRSRSRRP